MTFILSGNTITQSNTDTNLAGLLTSATASTVTTRTFEGTVAVYTLTPGTRLSVTGTLSIDPEVNMLNGQAGNPFITIPSGTLILGREITENGATRFTEGIAVANSRAQSAWFGDGITQAFISVNGTGNFVVRGATTVSPGMPDLRSGSTWFQKYTHFPKQYITTIDNDPLLASEATPALRLARTNAGINIPITNINLTLSQALRGYIGWVRSSNVLYEDYTLVGGGEISYAGPAEGDNSAYNSITGLTRANSFGGFSASQVNTAILAERASTQLLTFRDTRIAGNGNLKDIAINSDPNTALTNLTSVTITNEADGSNLILVLDVTGSDFNRNWGYIELNREVNFDIKNGLTGASISDGITFMRDHSNRDRKNINGHNNLADKIYQGTLSSGSLTTDYTVLEKVFNTPFPNNNNGAGNEGIGRPNSSDAAEGTDRSSDITRVTDTQVSLDNSGTNSISVEDRIVIVIVPQGGTYKDDAEFFAFRGESANTTSRTYAVTGATSTASIFCYQVLARHVITVGTVATIYSNLAGIGDLRGNTNKSGDDEFSFVFWHPEYDPGLFIDQSLNDGSVGTFNLTASVLPDANYSSTSSSAAQANNADQLYDFIKQTKCQVAQTTNSINGTVPLRVQNNGGTSSSAENKFPVEYPTISTLAVKNTGDNLDIGTRNFSISTSTTGQYTISNSILQPHSGSTNFGGGTIFRGVETTEQIDLTNIELSTLAIKCKEIKNLPFSTNSTTVAIPAGANLSGEFAETSDQGSALRFLVIDSSADISELVLDFNSSGNVEIFGKAASDFTTTAPKNSGTGEVIFPTPTTSTSVIMPSALITGFYVLRNLDSNTNISKGTHTTGTTTTLEIVNSGTDGSNHRIYFLGSFISTGTKRFHAVNFINFVNDTTSGDKIITVSEIEIADVLTAAAEAVTPGTETGVFSQPTSTTGLVTIANATTQLSAARTQRLWLLARETAVANSSLYLEVMANNEVTLEYILPIIQAGTSLDTDVITMTATDQQIITALSRTDDTKGIATFVAGGKTFASVIVIANPAGLSVGEAQIACSLALNSNDLTKENVDGIIAQNTTIPEANKNELNSRRVTRENMNNLGILAPINDSDPT